MRTMLKVLFALMVMITLLELGTNAKVKITPESRRRWCTSNQSSIDKCVGVWESQNVWIRPGPDVWIEVDTRGRVARVSPAVAALNGGVPERDQLGTGSLTLWNYTKDEGLFVCPGRLQVVGRQALDQAPEVHFRWLAGKEPVRELCGRTRGVICLLHGDVGPRDQPDPPHNSCDP